MSPAASPPEASQLPQQRSRPHLAYLDGLRALAALYVVHEHVIYYVLHDNPSTPLLKWVGALRHGHYAVILFIVLSGYCLSIPVMRSGGEILGGFRTYITRRARRILPPYYAALFFSGLLIGIKAVLTKDADHGFELLPWISHLLLIHNLIPQTAYSLNGPLWSVATEWQIYFVFPLFLLPIWKKFGKLAAVLGGLALGMALLLLFPSISLACSWFIALFALGMVAADFHFNPAHQANSPQKPYLLWASLTGIAGLMLATFYPQYAWANAIGLEALKCIPLDLWLGLSAFLLLMGLYQAQATAAKTPILKFLEWPPLVKIGGFSYSIYLIHMPIVGLINWGTKKLGFSYYSQYLFLAVVSFVSIVAVSYIFFLLFERPFLNTKRRKL